MRILGIETSCDDTAAAVVEIIEEGGEPSFSVLSNVAASQVKAHNKTGGVVPEVAARAHQEKILEVVKEALTGPGLVTSQQGQALSIDAIAVTYGPGLLTSLMVGTETAKTLSYLTGKPLIAVNHMAGHIYANWLSASLTPILFPALALLVSGGHTELVLMRGHLDFEVIGKTRDDAAGECFDKVAKMLELGYPGGPAVAKMADEYMKCHPDESRDPGPGSRIKSGMTTEGVVNLPRPMLDSKDYDFSFSGLKTAVMYWLKNANRYNTCHGLRGGMTGIIPVGALCHEVQNAIVEVLIAKTIRAAKEYNVKTVMLGGGVAANNHLREELGKALSFHLPSTTYTLVPRPYTTDNAAMIAAAGYFYAQAKKFISWKDLKVDAKVSL